MTILAVNGILSVLHAADPEASYAQSGSLSAKTIVTLEYFPRWETPLDSAAHKAMIQLAHDCPDFAAFSKIAPAGSELRANLLRFCDCFEDAAGLIRAGRMNESVFFNSWYDVPGYWKKAQPWVLGLRAETANPRLYEGFEWRAGHAAEFWAEWKKHPPERHPLATPEPTADDRAVFAAFDRVSPQTPEEWRFLEELRENGPTFADFRRAVPPGSPRYSTFDWLLCYYDRAGVLVQNGILHPKLLFASWRSPAGLWAIVEPWVKGLRKEKGGTEDYSDFEWLANYEKQWRAAPPPAPDRPAGG